MSRPVIDDPGIPWTTRTLKEMQPHIERFQITRTIEIDAAHRVPHHASKCFTVHGHRYVIEATCEGELFNEGEQRGMVMDFGFLKECMMKAIHNPCDHGIILWAGDTDLLRATRGEPWDTGKRPWKVWVVDDVPTAENLARVWYREVGDEIHRFFHGSASTPRLVDITVWETPNCCARYPV